MNSIESLNKLKQQKKVPLKTPKIFLPPTKKAINKAIKENFTKEDIENFNDKDTRLKRIKKDIVRVKPRDPNLISEYEAYERPSVALERPSVASTVRSPADRTSVATVRTPRNQPRISAAVAPEVIPYTGFPSDPRFENWRFLG